MDDGWNRMLKQGGAAAADNPPFEIVAPGGMRLPLIFNAPHSGRAYPPRFLAASRLDSLTLRRSEDAFVDELFAGAAAVGAPLLRALFPRAWLDANREPYELDPRMFAGRLPAFANTRSTRVASGLGTIPRLVGEGLEIYAGALAVEEAATRIASLYLPYHAALKGLIDEALARWGVAYVVDCHSMPSHLPGPKAERLDMDIVLGDRHGAAAEPGLTDAMTKALAARGYRVARNKPYAGGFITEHYGRPAQGAHVVQIEINRALYMDERRIERTPGLATLKRDMSGLCAALARYVDSRIGERAAAE